MASRKRKRDREIHESLVTRGLTDQSLATLYERARPPAHWRDIDAGDVDPDLLEFSDVVDVGPYEDEHQDYGIAGGADPWRQADDAFAGQVALQEAIDRINADFERRARPFLQQQRRNIGVVLPQLAALQRDRDARIRELTTTHQRAQALERAAREAPQRVVTAHERATEQAAARAFALDLGRGRFLGAEPADAGRNVHDAWIW